MEKNKAGKIVEFMQISPAAIGNRSEAGREKESKRVSIERAFASKQICFLASFCDITKKGINEMEGNGKQRKSEAEITTINAGA